MGGAPPESGERGKAPWETGRSVEPWQPGGTPWISIRHPVLTLDDRTPVRAHARPDTATCHAVGCGEPEPEKACLIAYPSLVAPLPRKARPEVLRPAVAGGLPFFQRAGRRGAHAPNTLTHTRPSRRSSAKARLINAKTTLPDAPVISLERVFVQAQICKLLLRTASYSRPYPPIHWLSGMMWLK